MCIITHCAPRIIDWWMTAEWCLQCLLNVALFHCTLEDLCHMSLFHVFCLSLHHCHPGQLPLCHTWWICSSVLAAHEGKVTVVLFVLEMEWILSTGQDKNFTWHCSESGQQLGTYRTTSSVSGLQYPSQSKGRGTQFGCQNTSGWRCCRHIQLGGDHRTDPEYILGIINAGHHGSGGRSKVPGSIRGSSKGAFRSLAEEG